MKKPRNSFRTVAALAVTVFAAFALTAASSPATGTKKVFWVDLAGTAKQHPRFVYFTANSGGQVNSVKWKHWGRRKTVGKGFYKDTSPNFPGKLNLNGPAKLVAWKPIKCIPEFGTRQGKEILVYRHVKLNYSNGKGGRAVGSVSFAAGLLACK